MSRLFERFRRDVAGIVLLACALFLSLALISFHPSDPSFNTISKTGTKIHNLCGLVGSFLSDFLYYIFGASSWLFVVLAISLAVKSFQGRELKVRKNKIMWAALGLVVLPALFALHLGETKIFSTVAVGGALGLIVSHGLVGLFNKIGVAVILWATFIVTLVFYTEKSLAELTPWAFRIFRQIANSFKAIQFSVPKKLPEEPVITIAETKEAVVKEPVKEKSFFSIKIDKPQQKKLNKVMQQTPREVENWTLPSTDLLLDPPHDLKKVDEREISRNAKLVEQKLAEFDVTGSVVEVKPGPAVTMYEFKPAASVKINDITKLNDDLSLALSAESLRIIAPIPGRDVVGIETSNSTRNSIFMKDLVESPDFWAPEVKLPIALGKSVTGEPKTVDLRKLPHLLVAGTTGSGKSVFVMSLVTSLIMRHSPKTLKLILVDPKQVDLASFHKIPHLLMPPVKEARPAINTLKWLVREMEKRYRSMSQFGAKNIESFNEAVEKLSSEEKEKFEEKNKAFEANPQTKFQNFYIKSLPYIVTVIEEFADLMSVDRAGVEPVVVRLAQMARAAGIHLVLAMQSPRREVLTGLIKTNFPGRISFKVASKVDSTIILDQRGAERLLSVGDMLYLAPGFSQAQRYHGAFLKDDEIARITEFWMSQGEPQFEQTAVESVEKINDEDGADFGDDADFNEEYDQVLAYVTTQKEVSASLIQRRFRYGYPKAARYIEMLESEGVVGPANGSKPRSVIANRLD